MEEFFTAYKSQLLSSIITIWIAVLLKFIITKTIKKIGRLSDIHELRTKLIIKYFSGVIITVSIIALIFIWGVNFKEIGFILSSVFAVIGVALFASWSILSNITAGIILFFSFPYKIGDRIRIQDKDFPEEGIIEDIKTFHLHLLNDNGELMTYPNNLLLQKGVVLIKKHVDLIDDGKDSV